MWNSYSRERSMLFSILNALQIAIKLIYLRQTLDKGDIKLHNNRKKYNDIQKKTLEVCASYIISYKYRERVIYKTDSIKIIILICMKKPLHITTRPPYSLPDFTVVLTSSLVKFSSLYLSLFHGSIWVKGLRYV